MSCSRNWASSTTTPEATSAPMATLNTPTEPAENNCPNWPFGNTFAKNPAPTSKEVKQALDGNLCRCGSHNRMVRAVLRAADEMAAR